MEILSFSLVLLFVINIVFNLISGSILLFTKKRDRWMAHILMGSGAILIFADLQYNIRSFLVDGFLRGLSIATMTLIWHSVLFGLVVRVISNGRPKEGSVL